MKKQVLILVLTCLSVSCGPLGVLATQGPSKDDVKEMKKELNDVEITVNEEPGVYSEPVTVVIEKANSKDKGNLEVKRGDGEYVYAGQRFQAQVSASETISYRLVFYMHKMIYSDEKTLNYEIE
jgi:hypothetical protein